MNHTPLLQEEIEVISTVNQTLRQSYFRYEKKINILNFSLLICCFVVLALVGLLLSFKVMVGISVGIALFLLLFLIIVLVNIHKRSQLPCDVSYDEFLFQSDAFIVKEKSKSNASTSKILYTQIIGLVENNDFFLIQLKDNRGYLIEVNGNEQALWKVKRILFTYIKVFNQIQVTKKTKVEACEYVDNALKLSSGDACLIDCRNVLCLCRSTCTHTLFVISNNFSFAISYHRGKSFYRNQKWTV